MHCCFNVTSHEANHSRIKLWQGIEKRIILKSRSGNPVHLACRTESFNINSRNLQQGDYALCPVRTWWYSVLRNHESDEPLDERQDRHEILYYISHWSRDDCNCTEDIRHKSDLSHANGPCPTRKPMYDFWSPWMRQLPPLPYLARSCVIFHFLWAFLTNMLAERNFGNFKNFEKMIDK